MRDISSFFAAVKPSSRSDQFKILTALYCLKADQAPVSAKEAKDFLKLHFGTSIPANVRSSLRRYKAYVQVREGPPLKWELMQSGVDRLRELTGLALTEEVQDQFLTDVGIVCALEHPEFSAVQNATGGAGNWKDIGSAKYPHLYRACEISADTGETLKLVATTSTSMGLTAASIVTTQLAMQYRPKIIAMIGIAAGTRDGQKQFGDVLVADPSVDYNSGKVVLANGVRDFLPDPYPIGLNPRVRSLLQKYKGDHPVFETIRGGWRGKHPPSRNHLYVGPLGAADQVIDDATRVLEIQRNWRKLIGVEMETYGVYRACHEAPEPKPRVVSFKSVCDFAAEKSDSWQSYAAYVAAEFAIRFLKAEWGALWPKK